MHSRSVWTQKGVLTITDEEAEALAEKCTERYYGEPGPWRPIADGYTLEITSVREEAPPKVIDIPKRDFIPGWDD